MMIGGYFWFQGIDGRARWHKTAVEEVLPVTRIPYDDRFEALTCVMCVAWHRFCQGNLSRFCRSNRFPFSWQLLIAEAML